MRTARLQTIQTKMINILGNKKSSIWKKFAEEIGGKYVEFHYWHSDKAEVNYNKWKIIFDNYIEYRTVSNLTLEKKYTRILAPFISLDDFRFEIYKQHFSDSIAKIFGCQDVEIGYPEFDKKYIVKTNNEFKIKSIFRNKNFINSFINLENPNFQISDQKGIWEEKLPEKEFELTLFFEGEINDIEILKSILNLFKEMLDALYELKSIDYKISQH